MAEGGDGRRTPSQTRLSCLPWVRAVIAAATISAPVGLRLLVPWSACLASCLVFGSTATGQSANAGASSMLGRLPLLSPTARCRSASGGGVEESERSAERIRLSEEFSAVQAEISTCQVLLNADGDARIAEAYGQLVGVARKTVGAEARRAWKAPAITTDAEMNMAELFGHLGWFRIELEAFEEELARATLPRRLRAARSFRQRAGRAAA